MHKLINKHYLCNWQIDKWRASFQIHITTLKGNCKTSEHTNNLLLQIVQTWQISTSSAVSFCDISALVFLLFTGPYTIGMCEGGNNCGSNVTFTDIKTNTHISHITPVTYSAEKSKDAMTATKDAPLSPHLIAVYITNSVMNSQCNIHLTQGYLPNCTATWLCC